MGGVPDPAPMGRATLGFIGIHAGGRPGQPPGQDEALAARFAEEGHRVRSASTLRNPVLRSMHHAAALLTWRVDLVVVAVFSGRSFLMAELATSLAGLRGVPVVLFLHGGNLPNFAPAHRERVERVLRRAERVLAPSGYLASTFQEWGYDVGVIPNLVEIEQGEPVVRTDPRPHLLWMRTFHPDYDPIAAVRTFAEVQRHLPEAHLTMAGADHGSLAATRAEVRRLGLDGSVTFAGYLDAAGKRSAFASNDVFLNTNVVDNMPVSVLEAASAGLVPVATAIGGLPALLDGGRHGILVPPGDPVAMGRAVMELLGDPARYRALSASARALAERSSWPEVRARWNEEMALVLPGTLGK